MRLHLVRHGETDINASGRLQGTTNSTLTPRGQAQARELAVASLTWDPVAVYSSPLQRARGVAGAIANLSGLSVTDEPRIIEMDMGDLEGVTVQEMRDGWPDLYQGWRRDASSVTMPGGESLGDVQLRAMAAINELDERYDADDTVIAVTHNFTIRCIVAAVIDLPLANINHMDLSLGSRTTITSGRRGRRLAAYNAVDHLSAANRTGY
ncbi:MAG: histidine phosphatase family protein [Chloroflexota bacterium]|nr:histidine phosphatase family protein [Chloroflexota bacterium]MDE2958858.1 histidine phosphatase family protein [Chloroflexota bacterium]